LRGVLRRLSPGIHLRLRMTRPKFSERVQAALRPDPQGLSLMSSAMSQASLAVFEIGLNALAAVLDRLAPDMFGLARQVQIASDQAKNGSARLAGVEPPRYEDSETTFAELKERIAKTTAFLKTLDPAAIDAAADRDVTFPLAPDNKGHMKGRDYLNHFVLPNFYFHLTVAYAILRRCGVELGKRDFLGAIPMTRS
jgi:uncharacterized protein